MKRFAWILVLLLLLSACAQEVPEEEVAVFYYPLRTLEFGWDKTIFAEVTMAIDTVTTEQLLRQYIGRWSDEDYRNPFPAGTTLESVVLDGHSATVTLSESFAQLNGLELSIACTALAKTMHSLEGVTSVTIIAQGKMLDGKSAIIIDLNALL